MATKAELMTWARLLKFTNFHIAAAAIAEAA